MSAGKAVPVLFFETGESGGGSFQSLYSRLKYLNRAEYSPVIALAGPHMEWEQRFAALDVPVYVLRNSHLSSNAPARYRRLVRRWGNRCRFFPALFPAVMRFLLRGFFAEVHDIIQKHGIRLLYENDQINRNLFAAVLAEETGLPLISHLHSLSFGDFHPFKAAYANKHVSLFVAVAECVKKEWCRKGLREDKVHVLYNGIEEPSVSGSLRELSLPPQSRVLIMAARLVPLKRVDLAIQALSLLASKFPDLHLVVLGDGPERKSLEALSGRLELSAKVHFTGWRGDAAALVAAADVLLLPSTSEACSMTLLEAMGAGVSVIGSRVGGTPEIIRHEETGLLFESGDAAGLAGCMERMLTDDSLRGHCAQKGAAFVRERFLLREQAPVFEALLREAAQGAAAVRAQKAG